MKNGQTYLSDGQPQNQPERHYVGYDYEPPQLKREHIPDFKGRLYTPFELKRFGEGDNWPDQPEDWSDINE